MLVDGVASRSAFAVIIGIDYVPVGTRQSIFRPV
jgi:hypothetical protein